MQSPPTDIDRDKDKPPTHPVHVPQLLSKSSRQDINSQYCIYTPLDFCIEAIGQVVLSCSTDIAPPFGTIPQSHHQTVVNMLIHNFPDDPSKLITAQFTPIAIAQSPNRQWSISTQPSTRTRSKKSTHQLQRELGIKGKRITSLDYDLQRIM